MPEVFDLKCPEPGCDGMLTLRNSRFGQFYGCTRYPRCKGAHGAHPDGTPLGIPADEATKKASVVAHAAFDLLWEPVGAPYSRGAAYFEMRAMMGLSEEDAHIGNFDIDQCTQLVEKVHKRLARLSGSDKAKGDSLGTPSEGRS